MIKPKNLAVDRSALVLVRTPFQAWMAERVLHAEEVTSYDLVYATQNDSTEDRKYFGSLSARANNNYYCYSPIRKFDILGHLYFRRKLNKYYCDQGHDLTLMASINSPVINAISFRQISSELVTFDDGLANVMPSGMYYVESLSRRGRIFRKLLGATDLVSTKNRISRHYTLYPNFKNIVESGRLKNLGGWRGNNLKYKEGYLKTYFVGQPFEEVLTTEQIKLLEVHLRTLDIDFYLRHPREKNILDIGVPCLEKNGYIAEEAIVNDSGVIPFHVIGWFSTVLFNLGELAQRRTIILIGSDKNSSQMSELAQKAGCEVVFI